MAKRPLFMQKTTTLLFSFSFIFILLSACTFSRIGLHMMPAVSDYKLFPKDTIFAAASPSASFVEAQNPNILPPLAHWLPKDYRKGEENWAQFMKKSHSTAFLVLRNDSLLFEDYANRHEKYEPQVVFSISKAITALLVGIAIGEGKISAEQPVSDFIPEFSDPERRGIKIFHLLNMVSGIDFKDERDFGKLSVLYYNNDQDKYIRNFDAVEHRPGTHFAYKSLATQILSSCLETATGQSVGDYLSDKLWQPMGMECPALLTVDSREAGNQRAFGGFALCSRDLLRLGQLLLHKGNWQGQQLVPKDFIEQIINRQEDGRAYWGYRNCFWRNGDLEKGIFQDRDFFASGYLGQFIYVNPDRNLVVIRQGKKESFHWRYVFNRLARSLDGESTDLNDHCQNFSAQFEGIYAAKDGEEIQLIQHTDKKGETFWIWKGPKEENQKLKQFDGLCIGKRSLKTKKRLIFNTLGNSIQGFHLDNQDQVDLKYYQKKSSISLKSRKALMAEF